MSVISARMYSVDAMHFLLLLCSFRVIKGYELPHEVRLSNYINSRMNLYGDTRPRSDPSQHVTVTFGLRLIHVSVDEANNILKTSLWIRQRWRNDHISWNASDYGGINITGISSDNTWIPDVTLVNTGSTGDDTRAADIRVDSDGNMFWLTHRVYESACLMDLRDYPYDQQTCHLWFQSLSYPSGDMDLQPYEPGFDQDTYLSEFKKADEWEIVNTETIRVRSPQDLGELLVFSRRVTLRFSLTLRRRAGFQAYILCLPCVVLGTLSTLVFVLPPERPDRHAITTALLGSFVLLLLLLVQTAPPSAASVPQLGFLYAANIGNIVLSLALSSIVVNMSKRGDKHAPFPQYLEPVVYALGKVCCISYLRSGGSNRKQSLTNGLYDDQKSCGVPDIGNPPEKDGSVSAHLYYMQRIMARIEDTVMKLCECLTDPPPKSPLEGFKWKLLAAILDRVFLVVQCTLIIVCTSVLYPRASYE